MVWPDVRVQACLRREGVRRLIGDGAPLEYKIRFAWRQKPGRIIARVSPEKPVFSQPSLLKITVTPRIDGCRQGNEQFLRNENAGKDGGALFQGNGLGPWARMPRPSKTKGPRPKTHSGWRLCRAMALIPARGQNRAGACFPLRSGAGQSSAGTPAPRPGFRRRTARSPRTAGARPVRP